MDDDEQTSEYRLSPLMKVILTVTASVLTIVITAAFAFAIDSKITQTANSSKLDALVQDVHELKLQYSEDRKALQEHAQASWHNAAGLKILELERRVSRLETADD